MELISRKEAKNRGLSHYFTGKPCKNGHIAKRTVGSCGCVKCIKDAYHTKYKLKAQQRYKENREELIQKQKERTSRRAEEVKEYQKQYRERTAGERLQYHRDYYQANKDQLKQRSRQYYRDNQNYYAEFNRQYYADNQEYLKEYQQTYYQENQEDILNKKKEYYKDNQSDFIARNALRRARKEQATPEWYEHDKIIALYEEAARISEETNIPYHIDHIVPLQNDLVCGLHCIDNLQILTAEENLSKGNKFQI